MSILLTPEEIVEIVKGFQYSSAGAPPQWWRHEYPKFAQAQLKKVVEWGDEPCREHHEKSNIINLWLKHECEECWQALKKEAGLD